MTFGKLKNYVVNGAIVHLEFEKGKTAVLKVLAPEKSSGYLAVLKMTAIAQRPLRGKSGAHRIYRWKKIAMASALLRKR